jgi:calcium-dependent protein kinase
MKRSSTIGGSVIKNAMGGMVMSKNTFNKDHFKDGVNVRADYEIGRLINSSSFGETHACINHRSKIKRMVKTIMKESLDNEECERVRFETRQMKTMDHPNMVTMYEVYQDKKKIYIIFEYLRGTEIFDSVTSWNNFSESDAARLMKQIFSTIAYCHSNRIFHRDLRPENILVEGIGE